jgi:hypothetical protein
VIEVSPSIFKARSRQILLVNGFFNAATTSSAIQAAMIGLMGVEWHLVQRSLRQQQPGSSAVPAS